MLMSSLSVICTIYIGPSDIEPYETVGDRDLINCRDVINDIDYFNNDYTTVIIDELCAN